MSEVADYKKWENYFNQFRRTGVAPTKAALLKQQQKLKKAYAKFYRC